MIKMKEILAILCIAALVITTTVRAQTAESKNDKMEVPKERIAYQCPMKCEGEKTYEKPGNCPICGMNLKEVHLTNTSYSQNSTANNSSLKIIGAMRNVMMKGELFGTIDLDTISDKQHIYGLGPVEYLTGEIIIIDGKAYKSVVTDEKTMKVNETFKMKAPFFAYANIESWLETEIPVSISTIQQLEAFIDHITKSDAPPFFFKVTAIVNTATIHVVNLPKGTKVSSPDDSHKGQRSYIIKNEPIELLGFFSRAHRAIFTHHDTNVHIHLITADRQKMGHLDSLNIRSGSAKLYLQK